MKFFSIIFFLCSIQSCSSINKELGLKDDNVFEESVENYIKKETGIEVDFTPIQEE